MQISWSANIVEPLTEVLKAGGLPKASQAIVEKIVQGVHRGKK
jgi:hypothetical protein